MCVNKTNKRYLISNEYICKQKEIQTILYLTSSTCLAYTHSPSKTSKLKSHQNLFISNQLKFVSINHSTTQLGSVQYSAHNYGFGGNMPSSNCGNNSVAPPCGGITGRAVHERSHSDGTQTAPLPSVDLSMESSSVTSLSNLPLRKTITSGKCTLNIY